MDKSKKFINITEASKLYGSQSKKSKRFIQETKKIIYEL